MRRPTRPRRWPSTMCESFDGQDAGADRHEVGVPPLYRADDHAGRIIRPRQSFAKTRYATPEPRLPKRWTSKNERSIGPGGYGALRWKDRRKNRYQRNGDRDQDLQYIHCKAGVRYDEAEENIRRHNREIRGTEDAVAADLLESETIRRGRTAECRRSGYSKRFA